MTLDPWHILTANFGQVPKPYTAFATLLDMALYFIVSLNVGIGRKKYQVEAPSTDGPPEFQRIFRVQMNTLEQLAFHLPLLWIAAYAMDDVFAAMLGLMWFFGRSLYAVRYYQKANRRTKGFVIAMGANIILFVGAVAGTVASF
jgi:hypothetical protein